MQRWPDLQSVLTLNASNTTAAAADGQLTTDRIDLQSSGSRH